MIENKSEEEHTLLIVDDEAPCRHVVGEMLEMLGYRTIRASSGQEAIDICKNNGNISLALVDMVMPGLSGIGTMTKINLLKPEMKFILLTGLSLENYERNGSFQRIGCCGFIQKPCTIQELSDKVRLVLEWTAL